MNDDTEFKSERKEIQPVATKKKIGKLPALKGFKKKKEEEVKDEIPIEEPPNEQF